MNRSFIYLTIFSASLLLFSCGGETTTTTPSGDSTKTSTEEKKPDAIGSASSDAPKRYGIEKGKVVYSYTGMQKGTETMWFSDWGWKEVKETSSSISMGSITSEEKRWSRTDKDWMYSVDLKSKKGSKFKNTLMTSLTPEQAKDIAAVGMEMMRQMGAEKTGNENIGGKDCDVYEVKKMGTKIWVWKNITLKTSVSMGGMKMEITATEVVEGGDIPEEKFNFPEGVDPATLLEMSLPSMK